MKDDIISRIKVHDDFVDPIRVVYSNYVDGPDRHFLHLNNVFEMYIYISGDADYIVADNYYNLMPYDVIFINPFVPHKVVLKSQGNYKRFYILIPQESFGDMKINPLKMLQEKAGGKYLFSMDKKSKEKLAKILKYFEHPQESVGMGGYISFVKFLEIFELLLSSENTNHDEQKKHIPDIVLNIMKEIDNTDKYDITLQQLSDRFNLSESQLSKIFKKYTTVGVKHYILMKKVGKAKELIGTGCSITEACFESGFNDCSYFTKIFKKCMGITPGQYKSLTEKKYEN